MRFDQKEPIRLGELVSINKRSYNPRKNWGFINYLDTGNITENIIDEIKFLEPNIDKIPSRARRIVEENDIIFSTVRPNQRHYGLIEVPLENMLVSTGFAVLTPKESIVDSKYLYYYLTQDNIIKLLHSIAEQSTSAYPSIRPIDLQNLEIVLPCMNIQRQVANTLSCLDKKIELNNKINENLEQQAQAIFKNWFVDFEPFQDGKFVESELGMIPEGWKVTPISSIVKQTLTGDWGKDSPQDNYTKRVFCIRGADIPQLRVGNGYNMPKRYILKKSFDTKHLKADDIVIEMSGGSPTQSTGRAVRISEDVLKIHDNSLVCTNFCRAISVKSPYSAFLYRTLLHLYDKGLMFAYENGTTGIKNLDLRSLLSNVRIVLPPVSIAEDFVRLNQIFEKRIIQSSFESSALANLRDTLLPKLMSGEIEVPVE